MMAVSERTISLQKLLSEDVVTRELSVSRCAGAPVMLVAAGAPGPPADAVGASVIEPEETRTSLLPLRVACR
ncbi:hypothetical protein D3C83_144260 [compost metagenome]